MEKEPFRYMNGEWWDVRKDIPTPALLCHGCKWPLIGKIRELIVSRMGMVYFHEGCFKERINGGVW